MNKFIRQTQTQSYSCAACEWNEVDYLTHLGFDLQYNTIYQKHKKCLYNYEQIHISHVSYSGAACNSYKWNEVDSLRNRMWQFQWKNARQTKQIPAIQINPFKKLTNACKINIYFIFILKLWVIQVQNCM